MTITYSPLMGRDSTSMKKCISMHDTWFEVTLKTNDTRITKMFDTYELAEKYFFKVTGIYERESA